MSRISTYYICVITFLLCCVPNYLVAQSTSNVGDEVISQVNQTLVKAGSNRSELEKVLAHYRGDDLKYKAACFLIANMDAHYSYASDGINSYYKEMDSVFSLPVQKEQVYKDAYLHASTKNGDLKRIATVNLDCKTITTDLLIRQIDEALLSSNIFARNAPLDILLKMRMGNQHHILLGIRSFLRQTILEYIM